MYVVVEKCEELKQMMKEIEDASFTDETGKRERKLPSRLQETSDNGDKKKTSVRNINFYNLDCIPLATGRR